MSVRENEAQNCPVAAHQQRCEAGEHGLLEYFGRCGSRTAILTGVSDHLADYFDTLILFAYDADAEAIRLVHGAGAGLSIPLRLHQWADVRDYALLNHCAQTESAYCGALKMGSGEADAVVGFLETADSVTWAIPILGGEQVEYLALARGPKRKALHCTQRFETVISRAAMALQRLHIAHMLVQNKMSGQSTP